MDATILKGAASDFIEEPEATWEDRLAQAPEEFGRLLRFMSAEHHRVRYFVVMELPRSGQPLAPEVIAPALGLPEVRVKAILEELERNLFFLVRNETGAVTWAFPGTVTGTPHHLHFSTGERLDAAWAVDAIATPFVQGRLRDQDLSVDIRTECAHCARPMRLTADSELRFRVRTESAEPLVFSPQVDWTSFEEPNITHAFWRNSVFFWSEEHAREDRAGGHRVDGVYLTLEQSAHATRVNQGSLFAL